MKLRINLKEKEASLESDVEKLVEKGIDHRAKRPPKKTRYQIVAEENRKNTELKHKHRLQWVLVALGFIVVILLFGMIAGIMNM